MKYISTRGGGKPQKFSDILLEGLAPDGGLYMPTSYPQPKISKLRAAYNSGGYSELAFVIFSMYIDDIPRSDLRKICEKTYTKKIFGTKEITPLTWIDEKQKVAKQGLSNGPTNSFKDIALQLLGNLFEYELERRNTTMTVLAGTSGDTGSAAEYAMRGKKGIRVFMLSPKNRMTAYQQAQMFSIRDKNIHNIQVEGSFDDCQDLVKAVFADPVFRDEHSLAAVNSINWARLLAQTVYYFAGYFQATKSNTEKLSFSIPSGNFGNAMSGHVARMMGLPIERLIVATNENDVLHQFFTTGIYEPRSKERTHVTSSPSMDISKASNFERFVFDFLSRDDVVTASLFGPTLKNHGAFDLNGFDQFASIFRDYRIVSGSSDHKRRLKMIRRVHSESGGTMFIEPHTADGLSVLDKVGFGKETVIVLETALPIKFDDTMIEALGVAAPRPTGFIDPEKIKERWVNTLGAQNDPEHLKEFIKLHPLKQI
jgi:threonine synthase